MGAISKFGLAVAVAFVAGCGGSGSPETATATPAVAASASAPAAQASPGAAATRDFAALRACEIVTPEEVAAIVGGKLLNEPPAGFANCAYVLETDGGTESYRLAFADPALYAALLETQGEAERGEPIAGLWDEAYVQPRAGADGYSVIVIRRDTLALEASGERREPALEIARLAASRVN